MDRVTRIPVRVKGPRDLPDRPPVPEPERNGGRPQSQWTGEPQIDQETEPTPAPRPAAEAETDWRERALRLQAEMENYRKRQRRLAQDQIQAERQRLLTAFLPVVDDLERALAASSAGDGQGLRRDQDLRHGLDLRRGLELTHRAALQMLEREGVSRVPAQDEPFDPAWHEGVSTVSHVQAGVPTGTVVQVMAPGYRLGEQLLRPARVVVAV